MVFRSKVDWDNEVENIRRLGFEGKSLREIGDIYNVSKQTINIVIKKKEIFKDNELYGQALKAYKKTKSYFCKWGNKDRNSDKYQSCREMFRRKKYNAQKIGIEFSVKFGNLTFPTHCPILGIELDYFSEKGRQENNPSFDRKDSSKGYVDGNVFVISWRANRIKNDGTAIEHRQIYEWMTK